MNTKNPSAKSAFNFFVADQKDNYPKIEQQGGFLSQCWEKWKNSDETVKSKYQKMADDDAIITKEQNFNINENV
jgi:hypothetical protein